MKIFKKPTKEELEQILKTQQLYHKELQNSNLYQLCLEELYEFNADHKNNISYKDFVHLFLNDIIFYQRPLKSKKSLISDCPFEQRTYLKDGKTEIQNIRSISNSLEQQILSITWDGTEETRPAVCDAIQNIRWP
jgi:CRISPR-associated endonuclease Csn1